MSDWLVYLGIAGGVVTFTSLAVAFGFLLGRCDREYRRAAAEVNRGCWPK